MSEEKGIANQLGGAVRAGLAARLERAERDRAALLAACKALLRTQEHYATIPELADKVSNVDLELIRAAIEEAQGCAPAEAEK